MGMLNEFESKLDLANKKLDLLIAKIDSLLGVVPLADPVDLSPNLGEWEQKRVAAETDLRDEVSKMVDQMSKV